MAFFFPATRRARTMIALAVTIGMVGMVGMVTSAGAQNSQPPATIPGLDNFSLPTQPVRPTPVPTPEPRIAPLPRPTPSATMAPSVTLAPAPALVAVAPPPVHRIVPPTRAASAASMPAVRPEMVPTPAPVTTSAPAPAVTPAVQPSRPGAGTTSAPASSPGWGSLGGWAIGLALLAASGGALLYRRRRTHDEAPGEAEELIVQMPAPAPTQVPPAPLPVERVAAPRARVGIALEVKRAGTNLLSAAVEYRIVLHNAGDADARAIALDLRLFGVEPALERTLDALFNAPIGQPVVGRFDLAAGATAALEGTAMLPRDAMPPLAIQGIGEGRALFVPVMTVAVDYGWDDGSGHSAASFVVGLDRGADAKLGPFRLDGAPRMYDRVRHLPFTLSRSE